MLLSLCHGHPHSEAYRAQLSESELGRNSLDGPLRQALDRCVDGLQLKTGRGAKNFASICQLVHVPLSESSVGVELNPRVAAQLNTRSTT